LPVGMLKTIMFIFRHQQEAPNVTTRVLIPVKEHPNASARDGFRLTYTFNAASFLSVYYYIYSSWIIQSA